MKLSSHVITTYEKLLNDRGEEGLFRHVIGTGIIKSSKIQNPEIEMLDASEAFFSLFRRSGDEKYFIIGKTLRRAAHKLYREFLRMNQGKQKNNRFLNLVK